MATKKLGDQELALLRFVADGPGATVGEIIAGYGEPNGLARSTVETVLERLRKKGFLVRSRVSGVFRYESTSVPDELMGGVVQQFVERTLGGSLVPFVTYFSKQNCLTSDEIAELERLVRKLDQSEAL